MDVLRGYQSEFTVLLCVLVIVQFFALAAMNNRLKSIARQFRNLMTGPTGEDLETLVQQALAESREGAERCERLEVRLAALMDQSQGCLQHIGLVRYDAFHDVSGHQSFSLAMLDGHLNGAIITGLFGRQDSRCFGKSVVDGKTQQPLSGEEEAALHMAVNGGLAELPPFARGTHTATRNGRRRRVEINEDED